MKESGNTYGSSMRIWGNWIKSNKRKERVWTSSGSDFQWSGFVQKKTNFLLRVFHDNSSDLFNSLLVLVWWKVFETTWLRRHCFHLNLLLAVGAHSSNWSARFNLHWERGWKAPHSLANPIWMLSSMEVCDECGAATKAIAIKLAMAIFDRFFPYKIILPNFKSQVFSIVIEIHLWEFCWI